MSTALKFAKDANGMNCYAPRPATLMKSIDLLNGSAEAFLVPSETDVDFYTLSFRYQAGTTVWVDVSGATAEEPAGNTWADTTSEMNPASLILPAGTNVSMITGNDTANVGVVMWQGGSY